MSRRRPDHSWYALADLRRFLGRVAAIPRVAALRLRADAKRPMSPARLLILPPSDAVAWQDTEIDIRRVVL